MNVSARFVFAPWISDSTLACEPCSTGLKYYPGWPVDLKMPKNLGQCGLCRPPKGLVISFYGY